MKSYLMNWLAAISVVFNVLAGGSYRNTFSGRVGYLSDVKHVKWAQIAEVIIDRIPYFGYGHCLRQYQREKDTFQ